MGNGRHAALLDALEGMVTVFEGDPASSSENVRLPPLQHPDFHDWEVVARGPTLSETQQDDAHDVWLWAPKADRSALFVGMHERCPPELFVPCEAEPDALRHTLQRFSTPRSARVDRTRTVELLLGVAPDMRHMENRLLLDAFMQAMPIALGTAATPEAPTPEAVEEALQLASVLATRYSSSRITLEGWSDFLPGRVFVARVEYEPAEDGTVVEAYNTTFTTAFPSDTPLDVLGSFHGMMNLTAEQLWSRIERDAEPAMMMLFAALVDLPRGPATVAKLEQYLQHPQLGPPAHQLHSWLSANLDAGHIG